MLRCDICGAPALAVDPGEPEVREVFLLRRERPQRAWCALHWRERFGAKNDNAGQDGPDRRPIGRPDHASAQCRGGWDGYDPSLASAADSRGPDREGQGSHQEVVGAARLALADRASSCWMEELEATA